MTDRDPEPPTVECDRCRSGFYPGERLFIKGSALLCEDCVSELIMQLDIVQRAYFLGYRPVIVRFRRRKQA